MFHSRVQPVAPSWKAAGGMANQKPGPHKHPHYSLKSAFTSWAIGSQEDFNPAAAWHMPKMS